MPARSFLPRLACLLLLLSPAAHGKSGVHPDARYPDIRFTVKESGEQVRVFLDTPQDVAITVTMISSVDGVAQPVQVRSVRSARLEPVFELRRHGRDGRYKVNWKWQFGEVSAVPDPDAVYRLPYSPGEAYVMSQGYGGSYSHKNLQAYDFRMPEGTAVRAAREGIVVSTRSDSTLGGPDRRYLKEGNYIYVLHADGTLAKYHHLQAGGVKVRQWQRVKAGEWLALSGYTGYTSTPHLHFEVFKPLDGRRRESLKVRMAAGPGISPWLVPGQAYRAAANP